MKDIYKEHPDMLKYKNIIDPLIKGLNNKSYHECEQLFKFVLHMLKTEATLKTED